MATERLEQASSAPLSARLLSLDEALSTLSADWYALVRATGTDLSMSPQWFASTALSRGMQTRAQVLAVFRGTTLVAVIPHVRREESLLGIRANSRETPGSYLVAYHPEVPTTIGFEPTLELLYEQCAASTDVLVLPNLEVGGRMAAATRSLAARLGLHCLARPGHTSPYLTIEGSWDQFLAGKPKKFRYKVRNVLKELQAAGTVTERAFEGSAVTGEFMEAMLAIEAHSWKAAEGKSISGSEMETDYYRRLLPFLAAEGAVDASVLYLDGTPIAYSLCYLSNGAWRQLKTSYDQRRAQLGAGAATFQHAIHRAFEAGAREFDFLGDVMQHKRQWASAMREHETLYLFLRSWRGGFVGRGRQLLERVRAARRKPVAPAAPEPSE